MNCKAFLLFLTVALSPTSLFAQSKTDVFLRLWSDHLNICGPLLDNPLSVLENRTPPPGFHSAKWIGTEDRTHLTVNYFSDDFEWITIIEIRVSNAVIDFHCSISFAPRDGTWSSPRSVDWLDPILAMINQTPQLVASGGTIFNYVEDASGSFPIEDSSGPFLYDTALLISGAFPDYPEAMSRFTNSQSGMLVAVSAFLKL